MARFLVVSRLGCGTGMAFDLAREGNEVRVFIEPATRKKMLGAMEGLLEFVDDWEEHTDWADVIVFDDTGYGRVQDELRKKGYLVVGGSELGDRLELERLEGMRFARECGMRVPEFHEFESISEGISFLEENGGRWVMKPVAKTKREMEIESMKELTFVARDEDSRDLVVWMGHVRDHYLETDRVHYILQRFVEGVEVATGVWVSYDQVLDGVGVNYEHKKLCNGDVGPATGEMGNFLYHQKTGECRIYQEGLARCMERFIRETGGMHVGNIDANYIVNEEGVWFLEFTNRMGYPAISIQAEALYYSGSSLGEFFVGLAEGTLDRFPAILHHFHVGVVLGVPPHPYEVGNPEKFLPLPVARLDLNDKHFHPYDIGKRDEGLFVGGTGYVGVATGSGKTLALAKKRAYEVLEDIRIPNMFYRTDIGDRWWKGDRQKLRRWGYLWG